MPRSEEIGWRSRLVTVIFRSPSFDGSEGLGGSQSGGTQATDRSGEDAACHRERDGGEDQAEAERGAELDDGRARGVDGALAEGPEAKAGGARSGGDSRFEVDADGVDRQGAGDPENHADGAAEQALQEGFARYLPDDALLRPADRLQGAELTGALRDRGERQQGGDQDGRQEADQLERGAELLGQVLRVDQRAGDALGEILRGGHG